MQPFSRLPVWRWEWARSDLKGTRAARGEALGCSGQVVTGRQIGDRSPPRPSRRSPKRGAAHPQRTFCLSFLWFSVSSKGASSSIMSPQRSFPGIIRRRRRRRLPLGSVATTTYGRQQRERKRGQGGRPARAYVTSGTRTARRGKIIPDTLGLNSSSRCNLPANEYERSRLAHPCSKVIGC